MTLTQAAAFIRLLFETHSPAEIVVGAVLSVIVLAVVVRTISATSQRREGGNREHSRSA